MPENRANAVCKDSENASQPLSVVTICPFASTTEVSAPTATITDEAAMVSAHLQVTIRCDAKSDDGSRATRSGSAAQAYGSSGALTNQTFHRL